MRSRFHQKYKKVLAIIFGSLFFLLLLFIISVYSGLWGPVPSKEDLKNPRLDMATLITDHKGEPIGKLYQQDRHPIQYEVLPQHLLDALITTEDARFYEHEGVDGKSLLRVFFKTLLLQDASSGGGSTITQQLAKNMYGRKDLGLIGLVAHKFRESVIASRLEEEFTKEEILEKYLNTVPFSDNTYGIESASRHFFSKPAKELTTAEAATLIGTLKATHTYNPRLFPERSAQRRNVVLKQMQRYGKITEVEYESLSGEDIELNLNPIRTQNGIALYFKEQVRKQLEDWAKGHLKETGDSIDIYADGLNIKTTLDLEMQLKAERAMKTHMTSLQSAFEKSYGKSAPWNNNTVLLRSVVRSSPAYIKLRNAGLSEQKIIDTLSLETKKQVFAWEGEAQKNISTIDSLKHYLKLLNTGWVSLQASTGAVRTWIGGVDYRYLQYDHVTQSKRQVGSVFKPIVYATAVEQGIPPCKYYELRKVEYENLEGWTPDNASDDDDKQYMNYSMEYALSRSLNTVAVKVLEDAGIDNVIETARKLGVTSDLPEVPSLALGTAELSVLELAKAYSGFLNQGVSREPYLIEEITDRDGNVLYTHTEAEKSGDQAFSKETAQIMLEMMKTTVEEGTARRIRERYGLSGELAGKTGTTQNNKDGWFVGLSKDLVSVSWVGLDDQRLGFNSTRMGQGANSALPMFALWWKDLQSSPDYNSLTRSVFEEPGENIIARMDCDPEKRDGFFKRLFTNPDKTKRKKFKGLSEETK